jgi:DNA polymerase sigma
MRALERNLQDIGMTATEAILHANTPIVKFRYPRANLECDINVNDLGGW